MRNEWALAEVAQAQADLNDRELAGDVWAIPAMQVFRLAINALDDYFLNIGIGCPHLVDLGCGSGMSGALLGRMHKHWGYTGYDGSEAAVEQARKRGLKAYVADLSEMPIAAAHVLLANKAFEYAEDPTRLLCSTLLGMHRDQFFILHRMQYAGDNSASGEWREDGTYCGQRSSLYYWSREDMKKASGIMPAFVYSFDRDKHTVIFGHNAMGVKWVQ